MTFVNRDEKNNPHFVNIAHELYAGLVMGTLMRDGLVVDFVDDDRGVHTDRLELTLTNGVKIQLVVPAPPDGWSIDDMVPV
jgi:hypothetical protein